jgi:polysaccharide pyruvyl transferase WcaK-like protein
LGICRVFDYERAKPLRILHVASFVGNIGDNASHLGFQKILSEYFSDMDIERLEIRKFYKNYKHEDRQRFHLDFIEYANNFDMLVIGGGGFFDYWLEGSATGTTIDMESEIVAQIKVPTLICSVGCMPHKAIPVGNVEKFRRFLDALILNNNVRIAVRNDGSVLSLRNDIGREYLPHISEVLDSGFFFDTLESNPLPIDQNYIAINITNDQLQMNSHCRGVIDKQVYLTALVDVITHITNTLKIKIVFVPHIYADLKAIVEVLSLLDDFVIREYISVAPCLQYDDGANTVFSVYKHSQLVIGSRFHTNVCSLAMGVPSLGLVALDRVKYVYDQLGMLDSYVLLDYDFSNDLIEKVESTLQQGSEIKRRLSQELAIRRTSSKNVYFSIFDSFGLKPYE